MIQEYVYRAEKKIKVQHSTIASFVLKKISDLKSFQSWPSYTSVMQPFVIFANVQVVQ